MFRRGISTEQRWFVALLVATGIIGYILDFFLLSLVLYLLCYVGWVFHRLSELDKWVESARRMDPPPNDFHGIWGEIADDVKLLARRYQKDKLRLQAVVTRVQEMTSALTDSVVVVDSRANIEWWNKAAEKMFAFKEIDRGHKLVNIIRHPSFVKYFEEKIYERPLELESMRKEGQFLEFKIHPFGQGERLVVIRDVTRMHRLEQMRKDFVANVSHELRTPLTVIRGYLETLADSPDLAQSWAKAVDQMQQQGKRMTALINDLITLSRLETEDAESHDDVINLFTLCQTIISDARALSGEQEHIFACSGDADLQMLGNDREVRSAISNLVFNAVKYSPANSKIEVHVETSKQEIIVAIKDSGRGIDPKHIPRLTERFYRVDDGRATSLGGTGLGLAIVKHVLLRHDAELKIHSRVGQGSTFSCHFPIARLISKNDAA
ncbi:Phosphate regulon sensor protein PhoR [Thalassocella blandensis]|nr:Phosphate regulon sensor protein PhoR [Thalassocella blandensis]